jgi:enoyl-CoA hydratase/carnithine racemase
MEIIGKVMVVTLDRPEKRNAVTLAMSNRLHELFERLETDDELEVAVLAAEGVAFCAGADLKDMAAQKMLVPPKDYGTFRKDDQPMTKPVIAAVNGAAVAGGFRLTQSCDLVVASAKAFFGITEVKRGRGSPWATPLRGKLPERIMNEILLTGDPISAERAYEVGFINRLVAPEDVLGTACELATTVAENAPLSVRAAKRMVELTAEMPSIQARESANWLYQHVYLSEDAQEGPRAFVEGRTPRWHGR